MVIVTHTISRVETELPGESGGISGILLSPSIEDMVSLCYFNLVSTVILYRSTNECMHVVDCRENSIVSI